jgi:DNA ligase-1
MITRPMLAAKATDEELQALFKRGHSFLLSPKIDGIRALVVNGTLVSRTMKPIRNTYTQSLFGRPELEGLDGELVVGNPWDKNLMQQTSSGVMSYDGRPDVRFCVFDRWNSLSLFESRLSSVIQYTGILQLPVIGWNHYEVASYEEMLHYEEALLKQGYEGVMLRRLDGPYKQNRSTLREAYLVKVKRFEDSEAVITGYEPLYRNLNQLETDERGYAKRSHASDGKVADELLGKVYVRDLSTGVSFSVGSGFTESQREALWKVRDSHLVGRIIKYKSFKNAGVKDAPRHPIFLGFRDPEDM